MTEQPRLLETTEPPETMMAGVLALAGWECRVRSERRIWRRPETGFWYPETIAYALVERGEE